MKIAAVQLVQAGKLEKAILHRGHPVRYRIVKSLLLDLAHKAKPNGSGSRAGVTPLESAHQNSVLHSILSVDTLEMDDYDQHEPR